MKDEYLTKQFTKEEAIAFAEEGKRKEMTLKERAKFQLFQNLLCMPFDVFHEAVEKAFKRPVYTHEFIMRNELIKELNGDIESIDEVEAVERIFKVFKDKPVIILETEDV